MVKLKPDVILTGWRFPEAALRKVTFPLSL
jgi:hypothetical protein